MHPAAPTDYFEGLLLFSLVKDDAKAETATQQHTKKKKQT
jgi:hypothetical protein